MITVWGEGRGFRVVWLLEEMGLPYRLRPVDLMQDVTQDAGFMAVNPAGFIPALTDGDDTLVESIAILQYLMAKHGPTPLAPGPADPGFAPYLQFLHLGEAGLLGSIYFWNNAQRYDTEAERTNRTARHTLAQFDSRLELVTTRLAEAPFMAGETFTAADISVGTALEQARYGGNRHPLDAACLAYLSRLEDRPAYRRAMEVCTARSAWIDSVRGA